MGLTQKIYTDNLDWWSDRGYLKRGQDNLWRDAFGYVYTKKNILSYPWLEPQYNPKFIIANKQVIELRYTDEFEGVWQDYHGAIFALSDKAAQLDPIDRCGVGWFSFPESSPLTDACRPHDFKYSSKVYQLFHNRSEADSDLYRDVNLVGDGTWREKMAAPFYYIVRTLGGGLWEIFKTRNK